MTDIEKINQYLANNPNVGTYYQVSQASPTEYTYYLDVFDKPKLSGLWDVTIVNGNITGYSRHIKIE